MKQILQQSLAALSLKKLRSNSVPNDHNNIKNNHVNDIGARTQEK